MGFFSNRCRENIRRYRQMGTDYSYFHVRKIPVSERIRTLREICKLSGYKLESFIRGYAEGLSKESITLEMTETQINALAHRCRYVDYDTLKQVNALSVDDMEHFRRKHIKKF